jgi:hypothetical protein
MSSPDQRDERHKKSARKNSGAIGDDRVRANGCAVAQGTPNSTLGHAAGTEERLPQDAKRVQEEVFAELGWSFVGETRNVRGRDSEP